MKLLTIFLFLFLLKSGDVFSQAPTANFTASQTTGCAPSVIRFQDQSTGNPTSWLWDFGNGNTSTLQSPTTTYFSPGFYTVTLTSFNASGSGTLTRAAYIVIYGKPAIDFRVNDSVGCAPFAVRFTDISSPSAGTTNTAWLWDFGNGTQSAQQNPSISFSTPGNYTISLKVTNDKGCYSAFTKQAYIKITGGLQLAFSNSPLSTCRGPWPVSFTNGSTGPGALSYFWDFGDGGNATILNPVHTYTSPGNYSVALAVTSTSGCSDTLRKTNLISIQNINTSFTAPDSICAYDNINFTNTSSPAGQSYAWDFGDGTQSTVQNPVKAFTTGGRYIVQLKQPYSYCTDSFSKPIKILPQPVANYTANPTFQCKPPLTVQFTDASVNAVSWKWAFGDGATSTIQNPSHAYTSFGDFDVSLIVTNASGCTDTLLLPAYIKIRKPVISFPNLPVKGCIPYNLTFTAGITTLDNVTSWLWDFGDGTTSALPSPSHTYAVQGSYNVTLTITTSTGCTETYTLNNAVTVGRIPTVDFTASPNPVCAFGTVQFTSIISEGDTWLWNFGDGTAASIANPQHQYTDTGLYTVILTVINSGCSVTLPKTAFIKVKAPIAKFTYSNNCLNRKQFQFTDNSVGPVTWLWDFGDGTQSTTQNPVHTFPAFGSYTISLTVYNGSCSHTKTVPLSIFDEQPGFSASVAEACKNASVSFTPASNNLSNIVSYDWAFTNGLTSAAQTGTTLFTTSGYHGATLITTDIYGCKDTVAKPVLVRINGPKASFTASNTNGCKGLIVRFTNTATDDGLHPIINWRWNYGDGTFQSFTTAVSPQHTYTDSGSHTIQLIVIDNKGCKDSISLTGLVNTSTPLADFSSPDTLTCLGSTVYFTNLSQGPGLTSLWNFGTGATSAAGNPSFIYGAVGSYTVKLKVTDQNGCSDSITKPAYITIKRTVAAFTIPDSIGICIPFEVSFTNTSQFYKSSFWRLGNGSSTINNPVQLYNATGSYTIQLIVTGQGNCKDTAFRTIKIFDTSASSFSYNPFGGCKPLQISLSSVTPTPVKYFWDFGDGSTVSTTVPNTVHTYQVFGDFVPKLILTDSSNCVVPIIGKDTIRIIGVKAKFGWDNKLFCDSGTVRFTDSTTYNDAVTSYTWNFGDGSSSAATSPVHYFPTPGLYTVSLALQTVQNCRDTLSLTDLIKVVQSPSISVLGDTVICRNDVLQHVGIFNRADTSAVQWLWKFPNGITSNVQLPPPQQYTTAGNFIVQTVVVNSSGCTDSVARTLVVNPLPTVIISSPITTIVGTTVFLPATYSTSVRSYSWTPAATLSCADCPGPLANPKFNTRYKVVATDSNGCNITGHVEVIVLCKNANVFVPNTFSPNNDGSNDFFYVRGRGLNRVKLLRIIDRWGEVVFEKTNFGVNDESAGWNGSYKGKKLPGTYIYQVEVFCDNGDTIRFDGSIALIL